MLKIIKVPDESTFTESDLKPDLKVLHKDGRQFTLNKHGSSYWTLTYQGVAFEKGDSLTLMFPREIVPLLNRDFRRAEDAPPQYKTVGEVPEGWIIATEVWDIAYVTNFFCGDGSRRCVNLETGWGLEIPIADKVTRVYGPITIDPSVTEGV